jgi:predicted transcriptional regulator
MTRLETFMRKHNLTDAHLATHAALTPRLLSAIRHGASDPRLPTMRNVARAASAVVGRKVRLTELFDLGDGER